MKDLSTVSVQDTHNVYIIHNMTLDAIKVKGVALLLVGVGSCSVWAGWRAISGDAVAPPPADVVVVGAPSESSAGVRWALITIVNFYKLLPI